MPDRNGLAGCCQLSPGPIPTIRRLPVWSSRWTSAAWLRLLVTRSSFAPCSLSAGSSLQYRSDGGAVAWVLGAREERDVDRQDRGQGVESGTGVRVEGIIAARPDGLN